MPRKSLSSIYQLKVTLKGTKPPIWRRIQVPGTISFFELHLVIQAVMPWLNYHLFEFQVGETSYSDPDPEDADYGRVVKNARKARLQRVLLGATAKMTYVYDFGDDWVHDVLVEKLLAPEPGVTYPRCMAGRRAAPPEDVGGVYGYADFLEAIQDPDHEEHDRMLEWVGGAFDAGSFELDEANAELASFRFGARGEPSAGTFPA